MAHISAYPIEWPDVARQVKNEAGWRCVRCGHPHELPAVHVACDEHCDSARHPGGLNDGRRRVLTVHHLDGNKHNLAWWNLAALCQVCHLVIQAKVVLSRPWCMFEHSEWFKPYVAGYYARHYLGQELTRPEVMTRLGELLALERAGSGRSDGVAMSTVMPDISISDFPLDQGALSHFMDNHRVLNGIIDEYSLCYGERSGDWYTDYQRSLLVRFNEHPRDNGFIVYQAVGSTMLRLPHIRTVGQLMKLYEALGGEM